MEGSDAQTPLVSDETARADEETVGGGEEAALDESAATEAAGVPEPVEVEIEETLSRTQVISRLKAIVLELEGASLVVGGVPVGELAEAVDFELEYSDTEGARELEIELKWQVSGLPPRDR